MSLAEDVKLLGKYDRPGPLYTSYPTMPLFSENLGADVLKSKLESDTPNAGQLSLFVHLPFCHKLCWYCNRTMKVERSILRVSQHLDLIRKEIESVAPSTQRRICQVHLGGGTPNFLFPLQLAELLDHLKSHFSIAKDAELSLEVDPRILSNEQLDEIASAGFTHLTLGVQDFNPQVQFAVNRIQPYELVASRVEEIRDRQIESLSMDLIYGLPFQTPHSFSQTIKKTLALAPDRIALFNFVHMPESNRHMALIKSEQLPPSHEKWQMLLEAVAILEAEGYLNIGMHHFARSDDPLVKSLSDGALFRNSQGYWIQAGMETLSFGVSGTSMFDDLYTQNCRTIGGYEHVLMSGSWPTSRAVRLTPDDQLRRAIIEELICREIIDIPSIEEHLRAPFDNYFPGVQQRLNTMVKDHILRFKENTYKVTHLGRFLLRNIAMVFDRYLPVLSDGHCRSSRTWLTH